jgi:hypothetical protein
LFHGIGAVLRKLLVEATSGIDRVPSIVSGVSARIHALLLQV